MRKEVSHLQYVLIEKFSNNMSFLQFITIKVILFAYLAIPPIIFQLKKLLPFHDPKPWIHKVIYMVINSYKLLTNLYFGKSMDAQ